MMKLYSRVGYQDDYHEHETLSDLIEYFKTMGVANPIGRENDYGIYGPGYYGNNYISVYWGTDVETPVRGLNADELTELERSL